MSVIEMGRAAVGADCPTYIVFEAGPTHTGFESAKALAKAAKSAGGDAIKFQVADHNRLITTPDVLFSYDILVDRETGERKTVTEPLIDIWERRHMARQNWQALFSYCKEIDIDVFATVFFEEDIDWLVEAGVCCLKIASQDVVHKDLVIAAAKTGLPVQIDTGNATIGEIERSFDWILDAGNEKGIINHCPSGYPARLDSINLHMLTTLKEMFGAPVAFSDHTPGWDMDIAAVALGADMIEKTITLDRMTKSCEHMMSIEPEDMGRFVRAIRDMEIALGNSRRVLPKDIKESRWSVMRSPYLKHGVAQGDIFSTDDIEFRRPGFGLKPDRYHMFLGRPFSKPLELGHMLTEDDFM